MDLIDWNRSFETNIEELDVQHKKLVGYINLLFNAIKNNTEENTTEKVLCNLIDYAEEHFKTEEAYMQRKNYKGFLGHKQEHMEFSHNMQGFLKKIKEDKLIVSTELLIYLKTWFTKHVVIIDKKMAMATMYDKENRAINQ